MAFMPMFSSIYVFWAGPKKAIEPLHGVSLGLTILKLVYQVVALGDIFFLCNQVFIS